MKKNRKHIIILSVIIIGITLLDFFAPEKTDWKEYYENAKKTPYSCFVPFAILEDLFPDQKIIKNTESPYMFFTKNHLLSNHNFIIITSSFTPDHLDYSKLLTFIQCGNQAFIAAADFSDALLDTFQLQVAEKYFDTTIFTSKVKSLNFLNPLLISRKGYEFKKYLHPVYFSYFDSSTTTPLGINWFKKPNFIKIQYGKGWLFIHTQPLVFTNYGMLYGNYKYASYALSYLPVQNTIWDEYYKPYKLPSDTILHVVLSDPYLKTAYYLLFVSIFIYIIFISKRRQRIIPVIIPPKNTSLEFLQTISNLHRYQKNYKDIALKKYKHFLDYVDSYYYIKPGDNRTAFIKKLSEKSGVSEKKLKKIENQIAFIEKQYKISEGRLVECNHCIEEFYRNSKK